MDDGEPEKVSELKILSNKFVWLTKYDNLK
jgi:hypothetical protein